jgi:hypothetical protein
MWRSMVRIVLLKGPPHNIHLFFGAATFAIIAGALAQAGGEAGEALTSDARNVSIRREPGRLLDRKENHAAYC